MTDIQPTRPPQQSRSRRTLERIVAASLKILETDGPDGLTVQAIVEEAGSSVGSFYARFSGKDELLEYLGERGWREAAERWDRAMQSRDWGDVPLTELVEGAIQLLDRASRSRSTYLRALGQTPGGPDDAYGAFLAHVIGGMSTLLLSRADEIDHPEPKVAVPLGLRAALALLEAPLESLPPGVDRERRMSEGVQLLLGYLTGGDSAPAGSGGDVDFFDVWG